MVGSLLAWSPVAVFAELEKLAIAHGGGTRRRRRQERRVGSTGEAGKWSRWEAAGGGPAERPAAAKAIGLVWLANQDGTHTGGCGIACAPMGAWWQRVGGALATAVTHERDGEVDRRFRRRQRPAGGPSVLVEACRAIPSSRQQYRPGVVLSEAQWLSAFGASPRA